jgi:hypothetical protein
MAKKCPLLDVSLLTLTQGRYAIIDTTDYIWLNQWKWRASFDNGRWYARRQGRRSNGKQAAVLLHRFIANVPQGMQGDHINGDGLDNRRCNLRVCTHGQNQQNRGPCKNNKSGYKGVYWNKADKTWVAQIRADRKRYYLGSFDSAQSADKAYRAKSLLLHGTFSSAMLEAKGAKKK